jgi:hypothetical protein
MAKAVAETGVQVQDSTGGCCGEAGGCCDGSGATTFGSELYGIEERADLPDAAVLASLGCGNPIAVAELNEGEPVLDLGSGAASTCCSRPVGWVPRARHTDRT